MKPSETPYSGALDRQAGPALDIVAPGLLGPVPRTVSRAIGEVGELGSLRRFLARARHHTGPAGTPDALAGNILGDHDPGAAGPLLAGMIDGDRSGYWSAAGGCQLIADRDRLMVQAGASQRPTAEEARAIAASVNEAFTGSGWQLHASGDALVLQSNEPLPAGLVPLSELTGHYLDDYLPGGPEARHWRARLNELQMLLFEHPVNQEREARGEPPVNGLWFWGSGQAAAALPQLADCISSDQPVLRGMAALTGARAAAPVERLSQLAPTAGRTIVSWTESADALASGDAMNWLRALARFETHWAEECLAGLRNGSWSVVRLHVAPGDYRELTGRGLKHFWRRVKPLQRHLWHPPEAE